MSEVKSQVNRSDIQGLVAFGYVKLTLATYYLLRIRDADAARAWCLKSLPVATAEPAPQAPDTALQIGFTPRGLQAMGLSDQTIGAFSIEFNSGIAGDPSRSRRLGDIGASDPASWWWGTPDKLPDMIAMLFAKRDLDSWTRTVQDENWQRAFEVLYRLDTSNMGGNEPFGFHDGISQPAIDWKPEVSSTGDGADFSNISAAGEFVLGYQNEYGKYTGRPLIDPADDPERILPAAGDDPSKKDLGRNGTYLVVRQLEQDVSAFWKYLDGAAGGDAANRDRLGAAMVGRTRAGDPLAPQQFYVRRRPRWNRVSFRRAHPARKSPQCGFVRAPPLVPFTSGRQTCNTPPRTSRRPHGIHAIPSDFAPGPRVWNVDDAGTGDRRRW